MSYRYVCCVSGILVLNFATCFMQQTESFMHMLSEVYNSWFMYIIKTYQSVFNCVSWKWLWRQVFVFVLMQILWSMLCLQGKSYFIYMYIFKIRFHLNYLPEGNKQSSTGLQMRFSCIVSCPLLPQVWQYTVGSTWWLAPDFHNLSEQKIPLSLWLPVWKEGTWHEDNYYGKRIWEGILYCGYVYSG